MKLVINTCYGGFSVSHEAMLRIAEIKGIKLYPEKGEYSLTTYWTVPPSERPKPLPEPWMSNSEAARIEHNQAMDRARMDTRPDNRADPALVQAVEELGGRANGDHARLLVVEIPDGVDYTIEEYDGAEHVAEKHRTWP